MVIGLWLNSEQAREEERDDPCIDVGVESCCLFGSGGKKTWKVIIEAQRSDLLGR